MTALKWDTWWEDAMGVSAVGEWRDGVASNTGFPGQVGHLLSANAPAETQGRGAMHVHALAFSVLEVGTEELLQMSLRHVEEWMDAVLHFVQHTSFASVTAVARAIGAPSTADPAVYQLQMDGRHRHIAQKAAAARALQAKQLRGEDVSDEVVGMVASQRAARAAVAAASAIATVFSIDPDFVYRPEPTRAETRAEGSEDLDPGDIDVPPCPKCGEAASAADAAGLGCQAFEQGDWKCPL
eukprot:gene5447-22739_t